MQFALHIKDLIEYLKSWKNGAIILTEDAVLYGINPTSFT